jgi:hypothetical protein
MLEVHQRDAPIFTDFGGASLLANRWHRWARLVPDTTCHLAIPTRGFTAAVSVLGGTPPQRPFKFAMSACRFTILFRSRPRRPTRRDRMALFVTPFGRARRGAAGCRLQTAGGRREQTVTRVTIPAGEFLTFFIGLDCREVICGYSLLSKVICFQVFIQVR